MPCSGYKKNDEIEKSWSSIPNESVFLLCGYATSACTKILISNAKDCYFGMFFKYNSGKLDKPLSNNYGVRAKRSPRSPR